MPCRLLCLWKAAREFKEERKEGRKETKISFDSDFIFRFKDYSVGEENLPQISRIMSRFPDKVLDYIKSHFWKVYEVEVCGMSSRYIQ